MLKYLYCQKSIWILESEIELIKFTVGHIEHSLQHNPQKFKSKLSLIPKSENLGVMGMTEILTSLSLLGGIIDRTGENPATITFAEVFEQAFGFSYNDIYDGQHDLFRRKPYNLTKTLDAMKTALIKEYKRRKTQTVEKKMK